MPEQSDPKTNAIRIQDLQKDMDTACSDIRLILTNHLPHIEVEITRLSTIIKVFGGLILSGITALILLGLTP